MTSSSDDRPAKGSDEAASLLAEMRARVEAASHHLDRLTAELTVGRHRLDDLETAIDLLLSLLGAPVILIDEARRITGLSRGAAERVEGATVEKPLSSVLPAPVVDQLMARLDAKDTEPDLSPSGGQAGVLPLPGGGAIVILPDP
jgi:hypothetical protein